MTDRFWAPLFLLLTGCVVSGSAGAFEEGTTTGAPSSTTPSASGDGASTAGDTMAKLDVEARDIEAMECSSIEQTTTIVERPADIIVVADDSVDPAFVQSNITNLLPAMETEGVNDANVVLVVGTEPPPAKGGDFSCGAWNCRGASMFESFTVVPRPIGAGTQLADLLEDVGPWTAPLRDASWKHIWVLASTQSTRGSVDSLLEQLSDATDPGVVLHAVVSEDGTGDPEGFEGLTLRTGGVYSQGDYNLYDFLNPMLERIRGTALACEYVIPAPPVGFVFEPGEVNVDYDDGEGLEVVGNVPSAEGCVDVSSGWYYDDPIDPEQIVMCPQTCGQFEALQEARIEIRFGCATIPAE